MGADEIEAMRLGQFRATVTKIGIAANRVHGLVELVAVNQRVIGSGLDLMPGDVESVGRHVDFVGPFHGAIGYVG